MLAPIAPHLAEECLEIIGRKDSVFKNTVWFEADTEAIIEDVANIAVQINGKLRATIQLPVNSEQSYVKDIVFKDEKVIKYVDGKQVVKEIFVKNKIYNIVVR